MASRLGAEQPGAEQPGEPEVGIWYRDIQNRIFSVVAVDDEDTIEVQYYDGDVAEFDRETWDLLCVSVISEPNDGLGPYDELMVDNDNEYDVPGLLNTVSWESIQDEFEG